MPDKKKKGPVPKYEQYQAEEAEFDAIRNGTDDPAELFPARTKQRWSQRDRLEARLLYEIDGLTHKQIAKRIGMKHWRVMSKWSYEGKWEKGRLAELAECQTLDARLKLAYEMGLATKDQMLKAKELMNAKIVLTEQRKTKDGTRVIRKELPNHKIQNEGLKRAMELTGTKIETQDVNHRVSGEIVHKYMLPERESFKPIVKDTPFKEVGTSAGNDS